MAEQKQTEASAAEGPIVFTDFDGTITQFDATDAILARLAHPSWQQVEQEWTSGSIGSRECLARQLALVDASTDELHAVIDAIPVDPAFPSFYAFVREHGIPIYVLSDGFDYVIARILKRAGVNGRLQNGINLFSSALRIENRSLIPSFPHEPCEHGCATCKAALIRQLAQGRRPIIFLGDGLSDRFAVHEADVVFAKRQLLAYCREHGTACHPFETFAEVEKAVAKLIGQEAGSADWVARTCFAGPRPLGAIGEKSRRP
jgi:2,3-diketo-5-methylthio-1-phosphopentane phosphatase